MDARRDDPTAETTPPEANDPRPSAAPPAAPAEATPEGRRDAGGAWRFPFGILGLGLGAIVAYAYARVAGYT